MPANLSIVVSNIVFLYVGLLVFFHVWFSSCERGVWLNIKFIFYSYYISTLGLCFMFLLLGFPQVFLLVVIKFFPLVCGFFFGIVMSAFLAGFEDKGLYYILCIFLLLVLFFIISIYLFWYHFWFYNNLIRFVWVCLAFLRVEVRFVFVLQICACCALLLIIVCCFALLWAIGWFFGVVLAFTSFGDTCSICTI